MRPAVLAAALAALLGVGAWVWLRAAREPTGPRTRPKPLVETGRADRRLMVRRGGYSGSVEAERRFVLAAERAGRIERLLVDIGDAVERGQLVARLDDAELSLLAAEARARVRVAAAEAEASTGALETAERALNRAETLRNRGVLSPAQLDEAASERRARHTARAVAEAELAAARAALDAARTRLAQTRLEATWSEDDARRLVAERHVDEGDSVAENAPIFTIVEPTRLRVVVYVPEREHRFLRPGLAATVRSEAWPTRSFGAEVARVAPVIHPGTRQGRVELRIDPAALADEDGPALRPGMFVSASIELERVEDAYSIPRAAVTHRGDENGVFAVEDGIARWVPVQTGFEDGRRVRLVGEATSLQQVVVLGQQLLSDGDAVVVAGPEKALLE